MRPYVPGRHQRRYLDGHHLRHRVDGGETSFEMTLSARIIIGRRTRAVSASCATNAARGVRRCTMDDRSVAGRSLEDFVDDDAGNAVEDADRNPSPAVIRCSHQACEWTSAGTREPGFHRLEGATDRARWLATSGRRRAPVAEGRGKRRDTLSSGGVDHACSVISLMAALAATMLAGVLGTARR